MLNRWCFLLNLAAESKARPERGVLLFPEVDEADRLVAAMLAFANSVDASSKGEDVSTLVQRLKKTTQLGRMCAGDAPVQCNVAVRMLVFAFVSGTPLRDMRTSVVYARDSNGTVPVLIGDVDRAGEYLSCRARMRDSPPLYPGHGGHIDTAWMLQTLAVLVHYRHVAPTVFERLAALLKRAPLSTLAIDRLRSMPGWTAGVLNDDACLRQAALRGDQSYMQRCADERAAAVLAMWQGHHAL